MEALMQKIEFNACGPYARLSKAAIADLIAIYFAALAFRVLARHALKEAAGIWSTPALPFTLGAAAALAAVGFLFARILRRQEHWTLYLGAVFATAMLYGWEGAAPRGSAADVALALLPLLPAGLVVWAFFRMVGQADEMQRQILLRALAFAFTVTFAASFAWAFLEGIGLPRAKAITWCALLVISWAIGIGIYSRRYGVEERS
jgi:predicted permease